MAELGRWTTAMRTGLGSDTSYGAVVPPMHLSSNYTFEAPDTPREYDYSRSGNPTRDLLNVALAELEGGAGATTLATGLAGFTLLAEALVPAGGRVMVQHDAYGGTWRLFSFLASQGKLAVDFVDFNDADAFAKALERGPHLVMVETPSNPLLRITDIRATAGAARAAGALSVVDNTFCSPLLQRPLDLGADLVMHSTTKFINGHSDVVGGAVIARDPALHEKLRLWANALGLTSSAFDAYLTLRGLRTLDARLRVHQENADAILAAIDGHPALKALHHPGLPGHPQHALAASQQSGFGSLMSLELAGGWDAVGRFLDGLQIFHLAESLGGVESLVCHPETMTHAGMSEHARAEAGITSGLLRLSVGIEARDDLVAVVMEALDRAL
ncbi:cystathionine gamma-synthase [Tessaracoccus antarcticus]|uniref:homocysteine desulfhydrase n=1 Tax=Tessaracoccus antarcticus TaxID=2479848 RepID=A0A3M0GMR2_9ACTN|nr:cystathionine gamma-synthase [Tessaracoccus antarcticus]RMB62489.1 cystathionine gamma-synthase [Tessaracoccus antarcticus]